MKLHDLATDKILIGTMGAVLALLIVRLGVDVAAVRVAAQLAAFSLLVVYGWRARGVVSRERLERIED